MRASVVAHWMWFVLLASGIAGAEGRQRQSSPEATTTAPQRPVRPDRRSGALALGLTGHPHMLTPHLDGLFQSGAYLRHCFTPTPVCSPARTSIMTSRYGTELGITDWINPRSEPEEGLAPETPVWPRYLQTAGYQTALVGKWHLGTQPEFHPTKFGFDHFYGMLEGGTSPKNPTFEVDGAMRVVRGFTVDIVTDEAIRWLRHTDPQRPFCLCVHYREPHAAYVPTRDMDMAPFANLDPQVPNPDFPKLDVEKVKKQTRDYLACVHGVDRSVGNLLGELKRIGVNERTVVIYSSDHGYNIGHHGLWHKGNAAWILTETPPGTENIPSAQRPNMFDTSIHVPTCVRWPGVVKPGTVIDSTVSHLDWFPTILELAGIAQPEGVTLRGRSIVPLLRGTASDWANDFYAEYSQHHYSKTHLRMYRTPEWKLVRDFNNAGRDELYNLRDDPGETTNLMDSTDPTVQAMIAKLHAKILERMTATNDPALELARGANEPVSDASPMRPRRVQGGHPSRGRN